MRIFIVDFDSATPSAANSIRQRELLNGWLALYARRQSLPQLVDYHPERLEDTLPRPAFALSSTASLGIARPAASCRAT